LLTAAAATSAGRRALLLLLLCGCGNRSRGLLLLLLLLLNGSRGGRVSVAAGLLFATAATVRSGRTLLLHVV
jgi:hypothetical protein